MNSSFKEIYTNSFYLARKSVSKCDKVIHSVAAAENTFTVDAQKPLESIQDKAQLAEPVGLASWNKEWTFVEQEE